MGSTAIDPLDAAIDAIDQVAEEGELAGETEQLAELEEPLDPILLPDGKLIYPPAVYGEPVHEIACGLLDSEQPSRSKFLRLIGPPGTGKSQIGRAIAYTLWTRRGNQVAERHGQPFYGFVELQPGPSADELYFRYDYVPDVADASRIRMVESTFVQAMREGWIVMLDEINAARDVALLTLNPTLDGRLTLHLPATGETVIAQPGFAVILAYNPGLLSATDIPQAWYSRFPATVEVTSNWPALRKLGAPTELVAAAMKLDGRRQSGEDGLTWTPQFREIESLTHMIERVGERTALALFVSSLHEQVGAGVIQPAEAEASCRMLDEAGYGRYRVSRKRLIPSLAGYPRAVTR